MSNKHRLPDYIEHIQIAASNAHDYVKNLTKDEFLNDSKTQQAVSMSFVIIGESAIKIMDKYEDFTKSHEEIPWRSMRNMRNRMAHDYFEVNMHLVWETTKNLLPQLLEKLPSVLESAIHFKHENH